MQTAIWEEAKDFGNGLRQYRCLDIATTLGQSNFQFFNEKSGWRQVNNYDVRSAMHRYTVENFRDPF